MTMIAGLLYNKIDRRAQAGGLHGLEGGSVCRDIGYKTLHHIANNVTKWKKRKEIN